MRRRRHGKITNAPLALKMRGKKDIIPAYNDAWEGEGQVGDGWRGRDAINRG